MGEEGRIGGEVRNRTKGRSITSKDTAGRRKEKEAWHILSVCDSSLVFPQAFYLDAISLDFGNSFVARLRQVHKNHCYNSQHRNTSENALVTGYFQHTANHLASASS